MKEKRRKTAAASISQGGVGVYFNRGFFLLRKITKRVIRKPTFYFTMNLNPAMGLQFIPHDAQKLRKN